ncbi:MAG: glycosyltransferase family 4 protein [Solirubrobacteraceae bacterium]
MADIRAYCKAAATESVRGFDMVHAELGGGSLREFYGLRAVQRGGRVPTAATLHDPPHPVWWPMHVHAIRQRRIAAALVRRLTANVGRRMQQDVLCGADALFCLTSAGIEAIGEYYGGELPVHLLSYPIAGYDLSTLTRPVPAELTIGFFGYWYSGKGLPRLADALTELQAAGLPFKALLWGDISRQAGTRPGQRYREEVLARLRSEALSPHVDVLGFLDPDQVAVRLHHCDVVVLPYATSRATEALRSTSASMFEALAAGTPVIATDVKALREQITDGVNGLLIKPGSTAALVDALRRIHGDPALRRTLRAGAEASARTFDPRLTAIAALRGYADARQRPRAAMLRAGRRGVARPELLADGAAAALADDEEGAGPPTRAGR